MALNLKKVGAVAFTAIDAAAAKTHMRVGHTADDAYITLLCSAAQQQAEIDFNQPIGLQEFDWFTDEDFVRPTYALPKQPAASITSIKYTDGADQEQTINAANYSLKDHRDPPEIEFADDYVAPSDVNDVVIRFKAGYATANAVPELVKHAIKFLVAHWYANREPVSDLKMDKVPDAYHRIVHGQRITRFK